MISVKAYAAQSATTPLAPFSFERRDLRPDDVQVDILYCGVCHSDLHQVRDEWGGSMYPMVPGHEIVGKVVAVGSAVTKYKVGDTVGVGVIIDSCNTCKHCQADYEQYCVEGATGTYNAMERDGVTVSQGGYSSGIVVKEKFVLKVDDKLNLSAVAPLLCAGITTYSPLRFAGVKAGMKVGVVGLGGLGHMGVKFAVAFGAEVSVLSTSPSKEADAKRLGATNFILTTDKEQMKQYGSYFDIILDTVSANHNFTGYLNLLGLEGKLLVVGLPPEAPKVAPFSLISNRRSIIGSMIGSMKETQEMLDFCAEHNVVADVEVIAAADINNAYDRLVKNDVKYRFVIDMKTL
ncbi:NAD(P)-dependent alcohol dehydrogenase [Phnomibacter ginsenosidimutans]|uniref:NAD(P)-dependent alcohol dehydrogenase n=1 Tax=Phnomibacter ginsenosidimutans TaxID=2676868 RepID=UPI001FE713BF|nr:NAD(P)-dependent alcohol dehydrogenase [Phnomibacter ginsenosidimutans]